MRKLRITLVAVILFSVAAIMAVHFSATTTAQDSGDVVLPDFEAAECPVDVGDFVEGEGITCGYVDVPAFHNNATDQTIRVAVVVVYSTSDNPAPDPLVMGMGGPGGVALDNLLPLVLNESGAALLAQRDVIFIEQRGVKYTEPHLTCPEVTALERVYIADTIPQDEEMQAWIACRDRIAADGVDFNAFNSVEMAADIPLIVRVLGYEGLFNYYGVSYGTQLGQHLIRDHGDDLRSVILDGVLPVEGYYTVRHAHAADRLFRALFDACAADVACNESYPDLETVLFTAADELNANPAILSIDGIDGEPIEFEFTGTLFVYALDLLAYDQYTTPVLPQLIYDIANGDYTIPQLLAQGIIFGEESQVPGVRDTVICAEEGGLMNEPVSHEGLYPHVVDALSGDAGIQGRCDMWGVDYLGDYVNEPVKTDIPTLFLSTEFDPVTPRDHADLVSPYFSNAYSYTIPLGGHGTFLNIACVDQIALDFLVDPNAEPDASCLADIDFEFVTPNQTTEGDDVILTTTTLDALGVETLIPENWDEYDQGLYADGDTVLLITSMPGDDVSESVTILAEAEGMESPTELDSLETETLNWSIYFVEQSEDQLILVLAAPSDGNVYMVILSGTPDAVDALGESMLLPIAESFTVIQ